MPFKDKVYCLTSGNTPPEAGRSSVGVLHLRNWDEMVYLHQPEQNYWFDDDAVEHHSFGVVLCAACPHADPILIVLIFERDTVEAKEDSRQTTRNTHDSSTSPKCRLFPT